MIVVILMGVFMVFLWLLLRVNYRQSEPKPTRGEKHEKSDCHRSRGERRNSLG
jgi:hypothetical protein